MQAKDLQTSSTLRGLKMAAEKFDIRQVITDKIIALMERGGLEWKKGWSGAASSGLPRNGTTGEAYKGANVLLLWVAAAEAGYTKNVWMTFKQAQSLGACVRKGEKGTMCCYPWLHTCSIPAEH